ncbi:MAG: leucyl aminopeptidase, partial [Candidatus Eisenbacteria bacterium]
MNVIIRRGNIARHKAGAVALGVFEGAPLTGAAAAIDRATRGSIRALLKRKDFTG